MKKIICVLLTTLIVFMAPLTALAESSLFPEGFFPADIPVFEYFINSFDVELNLRNLYLAGTNTDGTLELWSCDVGYYSSLYFYIEPEYGYINTVMLAGHTDTMQSDEYALYEYYYYLICIGSWALINDDQFDLDEDLSVQLGLNPQLDVLSQISVDFEIEIGNVMFIHSMEDIVTTYIVSAIPYTENAIAPANVPDQEISILLNGEELILDTSPLLVDGRVLIPIRGLFEKLGAQVDWLADSNQALIVNDRKRIVLTIDSNTAYINGKPQQLDVPAKIYDYRTLHRCASYLKPWTLKSTGIKALKQSP